MKRFARFLAVLTCFVVLCVGCGLGCPSAHSEPPSVDPVVMKGNLQMLSMMVGGITDDLAKYANAHPELKWLPQFTRFNEHDSPCLVSIEFSHLALRNPLPAERGSERHYFQPGGYAFYLWVWPADKPFDTGRRKERWGLTNKRYEGRVDREVSLTYLGVKLVVDYVGDVPKEVRRTIDTAVDQLAAMSNYGSRGPWHNKEGINDCGLSANLFLLRRHEVEGRAAADIVFAVSNQRSATVPVTARFTSTASGTSIESLILTLDDESEVEFVGNNMPTTAAPFYDRVAYLDEKRIWLMLSTTILLADREAHTLKATFTDAAVPERRAEAVLEIPATTVSNMVFFGAPFKFDALTFPITFDRLFLSNQPLRYHDSNDLLSGVDHAQRNGDLSSEDKRVVADKLVRFLRRKDLPSADPQGGVTGIAPMRATLRVYAIQLLGKLGQPKDVSVLKELLIADRTQHPELFDHPSFDDACKEAIEAIEKRGE